MRMVNIRQKLIYFYDMIAAAISLPLTYLLLIRNPDQAFLLLATISFLSKAASLLLNRTWRGVWSYVSIEDGVRLLKATCQSSTILGIFCIF